MDDNLKEAKRNLERALGPEVFDKYLKLLRKWFSQGMTKEQFDSQARKLIASDKIHHHNEFFVAILSKCNIQFGPSSRSSSAVASNSPAPGKRKGAQALKQILNKSAASRSDEKRFRPSEPIHPQPPPQPIHNVPAITDNLSVCAKDGLLPDRSTMCGRALIIAWESGMDDVAEASVDLLILAVRDMLKNVLQSAIQLRRNFMISNDGFPHLYGVDAGLGAAGAVFSISSDYGMDEERRRTVAIRSKPTGPITLRDIYDGLKVRPDVLPCQTVSAVVQERILCKLGEKPKSNKIDLDDKR